MFNIFITLGFYSSYEEMFTLELNASYFFLSQLLISFPRYATFCSLCYLTKRPS